MLIVDKKAFSIGMVMSLCFAGVLISMFVPFIDGKTPLEGADDLFNAVSKQSSYYLPEVRKSVAEWNGKPIEMKVSLYPSQPTPELIKTREALAKVAAVVLAKNGAEAAASGSDVTIKGDLGQMFTASLNDAEDAFHNRAEAITSRYGSGPKEVLLSWHLVFDRMHKKSQETSEFERAKALEEVKAKALEVGYNYYGIVPKPASQNVAILGFALVFYLIYTVWWGYAIMYLCDGIGLQMSASHKKEH